MMLVKQPETKICSLTFPSPGVLLVTLTRAKELNTIPRDGHWELERVWTWMDSNPEISVGIFTGSGRTFCTGADLREWLTAPKDIQGILPPAGFCGLSQRHGNKPVLAAVNGLAVGGGMEVLLGCDIVICSPKAVFCLPDVKVGLSLLGGTIALLARKIGRSRATDMILTGRNVSAQEAKNWGLIDRIADDPLEETVEVAKAIAGNSPDAVWASREGIFMALGGGDSFELGREWKTKFWAPFLRDGSNLKEGISAFLEKRKPVWDKVWEAGKPKL